MKKPTVFISYSHSDSQFVDELADKLKATGVDVWIDKWKIKVGDSITQRINDGIRASDFLIVVLSCASVNSKWVREELNAATIKNVEEERQAFILPALLEECQIPMLLQHRKHANFKDDPEQAFQELLEVIQPEVIPTSFRLSFEPELILIPASEFLMGSDPSLDKQACGDEKPPHTLYLPDYYLAKTPVTNAQYAAFVEATGHPQPHHWKGGQSPTGKEDDPVVCVSWDDARAYCRWLSKVTGKPYRLPSEAEWEKGARGTDGRIYPWGNEWDAKRCNSGEEDKGGTTPVGAYPEGASPYGLLDVAGNVWQWTRTLNKPYPYDPGDGREDPEASGPRAMRGGSWYNDQWFVRCATRHWDPRDIIGDTLGFRVVISLHSP